MPTRPLLILLYGFPGAGKTHFARQLTELISAVHVQGDRIRNELFEQPRYDKQENEIVSRLAEYMAYEFLQAGVSVIYDTNAMRAGERRTLRDLAAKAKAQPFLIWLQIDPESALARLNIRDRRKSDDKYAVDYNRESFGNYIRRMQNPIESETAVVISGKHTFNTQRSAVTKRMYELGLLRADSVTAGVVKPGMVNLVPNPVAGRVDMSRRNIAVR
jgi:predicted kinase